MMDEHIKEEERQQCLSIEPKTEPMDVTEASAMENIEQETPRGSSGCYSLNIKIKNNQIVSRSPQLIDNPGQEEDDVLPQPGPTNSSVSSSPSSLPTPADLSELSDESSSTPEEPSQSSPPQTVSQPSQQLEQDNNGENSAAPFGRNRRVRQKNRYFLDFHCIDLTKGARTTRDDAYEAYAAATSTRTSRRSTVDHSRQDEAPTDVAAIESRYCRKCSTKTLHDIDGGCQACLYKKIVESNKRTKTSSQRRDRSKQNKNNHATNDTAPHESSTKNKRKATKRIGTSSRNNNRDAKSIINTLTTTSTSTSTIAAINISDNSSSNLNTCNNYDICNHAAPVRNSDNDTSNDDNNNNDGDSNNSNPTTNDISDHKQEQSPSGKLVNEEGNNKNCVENNGELPRLHSWTPDEVAKFIMSKGFAQEAELFKTQLVDGISLLLMQRADFTYGLKMKLGPALKIYDTVCRLKRDYFRNVGMTN